MKNEFSKGPSHFIFPLEFLAWLFYINYLLIKQIFLESYFIPGMVLATVTPQKSRPLNLLIISFWLFCLQELNICMGLR